MTTTTTTAKQRIAYVALIILALAFLFLFFQDMRAQTNMGPIRTPQVNTNLYVGQSGYPTIQSAVTFACRQATPDYAVVILPGITPTDTPPTVTGGCYGTYIMDYRALPVTYYQWSGTAYTALPTGGGGGGGGPMPSTTNLLAGNGSGGGLDSGIAPNDAARISLLNTFARQQKSPYWVATQGDNGSGDVAGSAVLEAPTQVDAAILLGIGKSTTQPSGIRLVGLPAPGGSSSLARTYIQCDPNGGPEGALCNILADITTNGSLTVKSITCTGTPCGSGGGGGGGGTPGGSDTQVQVNSANAFMGYASFTYTPNGGLTIGSGSSNIHGFTVGAGPDAPGGIGEVVYTSDATNGYAEVNEGGTGRVRICTATNGVCPTGGGGGISGPGGSPDQIQVNIANVLGGYTGFTYTTSGGLSVPGSVHGFTVSAGPDAPGATGTVVYTSDATNGYAEVNEGGVGRQRICTATNGVCPTGGGGGGTTTGPQNMAAVYNGAATGGAYAQGHANWGQGATPNDLFVPGYSWGAQHGLQLWSATGASTVYPQPGNAGANGITIATQSMPSSGPAVIEIEPNYTTWEGAMSPQAANDRMAFIDLRQGRFAFKSQNPGSTGGAGIATSGGNSNFAFDCFASKNLPASDNPGNATATGMQTCMSTTLNFDVPGSYYGALYPVLPTGWFGEVVQGVSAKFFSASINKSLVSANVSAYGRGDQQTFDYQIDNEYGGMDASADEGIHLLRLWEQVGGIEFNASLYENGIDVTASGYVTLYPNFSGGPTLGVMRHLLNTTSGVIADTVTSTAVQGDGSNALTMTSTSYPVSIVTTLNGNINPPASSEMTKTSMTFNVTTSVDLSSPTVVGTQAEFAGGTSVECGVIKAVGTLSGGVQSVTMLLSEPHNAGAKLYIGGMSCHFLIPDGSIQAVTNNAHIDWYVLGSTANNTLITARLTQQSLDPAMVYVPGAVHIYQGARVLDVRCDSACQQWGAVPGMDDLVVKVEETNATWHAADNILSGMVATSQHDVFNVRLTDNNQMTAGSAFAFDMLGAAFGGGGRDLFYFTNSAPDTAYWWGGGSWLTGSLFHWRGPVGGVFTIDSTLHGPFLTEFNCPFVLVQSNNAAIKEWCPGGGPGTPNANSGAWELRGDVVFTGGQGGGKWGEVGDLGIEWDNYTTFTKDVTLNANLTTYKLTSIYGTVFGGAYGGATWYENTAWPTSQQIWTISNTSSGDPSLSFTAFDGVSTYSPWLNVERSGGTPTLATFYTPVAMTGLPSGTCSQGLALDASGHLITVACGAGRATPRSSTPYRGHNRSN